MAGAEIVQRQPDSQLPAFSKDAGSPIQLIQRSGFADFQLQLLGTDAGIAGQQRVQAGGETRLLQVAG